MPALRPPFVAGDLSADEVDPDYLYFLQHIRLDGDSYTLEIPASGSSPASVLRYESPLSSSDGECVSDPSPGRLSSNRPAEEKDSSASVEAEPVWNDSLGDVDEDYRIFLQHSRLVDGRLVLEIGGVVVNYDQADAVRSGRSSEAEEVVSDRRGREDAVASRGKGAGEGGKRDGVGTDAPAIVVPEQYACDWRADPAPGQEAEDAEDEAVLLDAAAACTPAATLKGVDWEAISSNGPDPKLPADLEQGAIWPEHIIRRPDSDFKRRLIETLTKPVSRKDYYELFDMVTIRTPVMKLRQVRNESKFYPTEEMGNSYLDHHPDLADQVMNCGRRNGLALLRGFFFWLQNNAHDDQFKPWVEDSKDREAIPVD